MVRIKRTGLCVLLAALICVAACAAPAAGGAAAPTGEPSVTALAAATQSPMASPDLTVQPTPAATESPAPTVEPTPTPTPEPTPQPTASPVVHDGGPDAIGLYVTVRAGVRERVVVYDRKWVRGRDIAVFDAFASGEDVLKGDYRKVFVSNWNKYPKWQDYKIGYCLDFALKSGEKVKLTIRSPKDSPKDPKKHFYQYLEVYLYDDIHSKGWYSHLLESQMKPNSLMTSIKVTAGRKIADVQSAELTVFVFKDDGDFDPATGDYIGPVSHRISIRNGK